MGFVGRFEMTVPDILQILSLSKKTGKLRLSRLANTGEVLFKNGKVTFAASDSTRHTLTNILISQKRLTEGALMAALELQHLSSDNKKLGAILIDKGIITREMLQEALQYQIEEAMSEFLTWENGFFRFDMVEIADDDGIAIDVSEFLTKTGMQSEDLFLEAMRRLEERREVETPPRPAPQAPPRPERFDRAQTSAELRRMPRPEQFGPELTAEGHVEGLVEGPPRPSPELLADLIEGQWEGERPPWIKSEGSPAPDPTPTVRIEKRRQVETPRPPSPEPRPRPAPEVPLRPAPAVPAVQTPTFSVPAATQPPVPASAAPSGTSLEGPFQEIEPSRITDEIMLSSPIAPWVLIMHLAADVVSRGVLLFVRKDGITGHDQFGVGGGRDSGDERVINLKIPWNEPSILASTSHARTTYRGKIGPGKWNDYFLNQLGGKRPDEVVIIPIIVAGKVVAIFYGDDAGTGTPLGDVERLQTSIGQTFSAVEASILEKRGKTQG